MVVRRRKPAALQEVTATPDELVQQRLSLPLPEQSPPALSTIPARRLWLCIHFPALPLEALNGDSPSAAHAVFSGEQGVRQVLLASKAAQAAGIAPRMPVNAALALQPELQLLERSPRKEQALIRQLAAWAEQFTSFVCIESACVLLLEIAGSLRLFGGLRELRQRITADLEHKGLTSSLAIAPTPLAATWLARSRRRVCIQALQNLTGALSPLSLQCLDWPESVTDSLKGMGISCIGDCLRLPRQGFAKRFGSARLLQLDRAMGRLPDPRSNFRTPQRFCAEFELSQEQSDGELILNACEQLLQEMSCFLLARQLVVQRVQFSFFSLQAPVTHLIVGSSEAGRAVCRWLELLKIRFERLTLAAPVISIRLRGGRPAALEAENRPLPFRKTDRGGQSISPAHLVEQLSARIGDEAVHAINLVAEHRPQYAWGRVGVKPGFHAMDMATPSQVPWNRGLAPLLFADLQKTNSLLLRRPLWMLPDLKKLPVVDGKPVYQGVLELLSGPERIETGWWDDNGVARDYYVAVNSLGVHLWIYKNRGEKNQWFLHGIFG
ncbi:MAG: DNA polymerase Y family protein [Gammaproteobacteria bacterium]|nr:DNA polymerase Y family protein [Gammaproteobacteria bacterium]